jgi:hypothetical protein
MNTNPMNGFEPLTKKQGVNKAPLLSHFFVQYWNDLLLE